MEALGPATKEKNAVFHQLKFVGQYPKSKGLVVEVFLEVDHATRDCILCIVYVIIEKEINIVVTNAHIPQSTIAVCFS